MKEFPMEEFVKAQSFSVQGNSIEILADGKSTTLTFETEGELFNFLRDWASYARDKKNGGASGESFNRVLSPYARARCSG